MKAPSIIAALAMLATLTTPGLAQQKLQGTPECESIGKSRTELEAIGGGFLDVLPVTYIAGVSAIITLHSNGRVYAVPVDLDGCVSTRGDDLGEYQPPEVPPVSAAPAN